MSDHTVRIQKALNKLFPRLHMTDRTRVIAPVVERALEAALNYADRHRARAWEEALQALEIPEPSTVRGGAGAP